MKETTKATVVQRMAQKLADLDAAGIAIVFLRCPNRSEIRSVVDAYVHRPHGTMREVTGLNTVRLFRSRFEWELHGYGSGEANHGENRSLMRYLQDCTGDCSGRDYQLLYIPDIFRVIGDDRTARTEIQNQYIQLMEDIALGKRDGNNNVLIVIGCTDGRLCSELAEYSYVVDIPCPEPWEVLDILMDACTSCGGPGHELEPDKANRLTEAMRGFRESEIRRMIRLAFASDPHPMRNLSNVLSIVYEEKRQRIDRVKGLRWIRTAEPVGGMDQLQEFLREKGTPFHDPLLANLQCAEPPHALLLYGPPGCGKSLAADWSAKLLGGDEPLPLLHLSLSSMLEKWVGQSEANYEAAMAAVESIAPCVLVINELDKLFGTAGRESSSEVGNNLFSMFLEWMEKPKSKPILVMATANRIDQLPPESERKGRFDEVFSVSIPTGAECLEIIRLHLKRYTPVLPITDDDREEISRVIDDLASAFLREAAEQRRYLTGADIKGICSMAFDDCFYRYDSRLTDAQRRQAMIENQPHRYTRDEIVDATRRELSRTRTFLSGNMAVAADYWLQSLALDSRPASSTALIPASALDTKTGKVTIPPFSADADDTVAAYDQALREALAAAIAQQFKKRKGQR